MELIELMQAIVDKKPPKFIIMFGEEQKVVDIYIDKIAKLGYNRLNLETVSQAVSKCSTKSLSKSPKLLVVSEDNEFTKAENSWAKVNSIVSNSSNILIVRYAKINKTTKFYKRNKPNAVEFNKLDTSILTKYIKKDLQDLSVDNCEILIGACGNDYGRILLEVDKILQYKQSKRIESSNKAFTELFETGAIYSDIGDITFDLTNAITIGDIENSFILLDKAKRCGEPALRICSILYTNFRNMLSVLCLGKDKSNASSRTGIESKRIYMIMKQTGAYNIKECIRNINICQQVEAGIKSGYIDSDIALDYLVTSLLF